MAQHRWQIGICECWSPSLPCCSSLCAVAVPAAREYRTVEVESLRVTIDSDWVPRAAPGYLPIRFDITNLGDARVIEIVAQGYRCSSAIAARIAARRPGRRFASCVRLARGDRVRLTMPVPVFADNENFRFEIREGNRSARAVQLRRLSEPVAACQTLRPCRRGLVDPVRRDRADTGADRWRGGGSDGHGRRPRPAWRGCRARPSAGGRLPAAGLAARAGAAASQLARIHVRARRGDRRDEWEQLNDAQKNALLTWAACGGDLIFVDGALDVLLPDARGEPAADPIARSARHFFGRVHALTSASLADGRLAGRALDAPRRSATRSGRCRRTARPTGAPSKVAASGCAFRASTASRLARSSRSSCCSACDRPGELLVPAAPAAARAARAHGAHHFARLHRPARRLCARGRRLSACMAGRRRSRCSTK